jgi:hypothetical protein
MILALALLAATAASAEKVSPFAAIEGAWLAKGFNARERVSGERDGLTASAAIYTPAAGGGDRLEVYVVAKDKAYLGFTHPSTVERL